jgi:hypothetical protein
MLHELRSVEYPRLFQLPPELPGRADIVDPGWRYGVLRALIIAVYSALVYNKYDVDEKSRTESCILCTVYAYVTPESLTVLVMCFTSDLANLSRSPASQRLQVDISDERHITV